MDTSIPVLIISGMCVYMEHRNLATHILHATTRNLVTDDLQLCHLLYLLTWLELGKCLVTVFMFFLTKKTICINTNTNNLTLPGVDVSPGGGSVLAEQGKQTSAPPSFTVERGRWLSEWVFLENWEAAGLDPILLFGQVAIFLQDFPPWSDLSQCC